MGYFCRYSNFQLISCLTCFNSHPAPQLIDAPSPNLQSLPLATAATATTTATVVVVVVAVVYVVVARAIAVAVAIAAGITVSRIRAIGGVVFVGIVVMPIFVANGHFNRLFNAAYAYQINELRASQCQ